MTRIITLLFLLVPILVKAQWTTSGSNIYNTNTGNVGIGFTSPDRKLYVRGIYSTTNALSAFELQNSSATESVAASFYAYPASTTGNTYLQNTFMMYLGGTTGVHMNFANPKSNGTIRFHTAGFDSEATQRMIINYNGNIGIGNVNPQAKLHISGGDLLLQNPTSGYPLLWLKDVSGSNSLRLDYNSLIGTGGNLVIRSPTANAIVLNDIGGNVGIGTTTPAYKLHVNGAINATALYVNGTPVSGASSQWTNNGSSIYFNTGNLGLGTTTPMGKLDINQAGGQLRLSGGTVAGGVWTSATEHLYLADWNTGTKGLFINMTSGDIGIGTTNLSANTKLEVVGPASGSGATIRASGGGDVVLNSGGSIFFDGNYNYAAGNYIRPVAANTQAFFTSGVERMRITAGGSVGIGISAPNASYKLDVGGVINATAIYINGAPFAGGGSQWTTASSNIYFSTGNVGIGTTTPDAKLAVKGTVHAQEVKVDLSVPGPDYVFEKDYNLLSIEEIKTYIDKNKRLPEVPSAKEMEANGINLGEMNMLLLKKIEELTLHVIELEKRVKTVEHNN